MSGMIRSMPGSAPRRERDAEIDREPVARRCVAEAVDRQIHADLADAAERRENQFVAAPSAAAHSRSLDHRELQTNTSPAVTIRLAAIGRAAPGGRPRRALRSGRRVRASASRTRMRSPSPAARASQSARIAAKPVAAIPLRQPRRHRADSAANSAVRRDAAPAGREIGGRDSGAGRMVRAIDADADGHDHLLSPSPSIRMPATWRRRAAGRSAISARASARSAARPSTTASCTASAATNDSCGAASGRRRIGQQQAGVQIAGHRDPRAAAAAAAGALLRGGDPQRPALAVRAPARSASALVEPSVS